MAPQFDDNLISAGQLSKRNNVTFAKDTVFIGEAKPQPTNAILLGTRGKQLVHAQRRYERKRRNEVSMPSVRAYDE